MKNISVHPVALGIAGILLALASFYVGSHIETTRTMNDGTAGSGRAAQMMGGGRAGQAGIQGGMRFSPTQGKVLAKDATSMTVELEGGGSRIVVLSADTKVTHAADASLDSVTVGTTVNVMGTQNQDGSVTAQRIETGAVQRFPARQGQQPAVQ